MTSIDDFLAHHGVKGMKWGIHRSLRGGSGKTSSATAAAAKPKHGHSSAGHLPEGVHHVTLTAAKNRHHSEDAITYKSLQKKVKKHSVHSLSNDELRKLTSRFDLEQKYSKMAAAQREKKKSPVGRAFFKVISKAGDTAMTEVGQALGKKSSGHALEFMFHEKAKAAAAAAKAAKAATP